MEKLSQAHADTFCTLVEAGDPDAVFANSQTKPPSVRRVLAVLAGKGDQEASGQLQEIRAKGRERRKADREKQKGRERQAFISEATKQINETTQQSVVPLGRTEYTSVPDIEQVDGEELPATAEVQQAAKVSQDPSSVDKTSRDETGNAPADRSLGSLIVTALEDSFKPRLHPSVLRLQSLFPRKASAAEVSWVRKAAGPGTKRRDDSRPSSGQRRASCGSRLENTRSNGRPLGTLPLPPRRAEARTLRDFEVSTIKKAAPTPSEAQDQSYKAQPSPSSPNGCTVPQRAVNTVPPTEAGCGRQADDTNQSTPLDTTRGRKRKASGAPIPGPASVKRRRDWTDSLAMPPNADDTITTPHAEPLPDVSHSSPLRSTVPASDETGVVVEAHAAAASDHGKAQKKLLLEWKRIKLEKKLLKLELAEVDLKTELVRMQ